MIKFSKIKLIHINFYFHQYLFKKFKFNNLNYSKINSHKQNFIIHYFKKFQYNLISNFINPKLIFFFN